VFPASDSIRVRGRERIKEVRPEKPIIVGQRGPDMS
jgi:hypothetical protein